MEISEPVRVRLGGGSFLRGEVQDIRGSELLVKGRWFPVASVETEQEIDNRIRANERAAKEQASVERRQVKPAKLEEREPGIVVLATDTYENFAPWLSREDYQLYIAARPANEQAARSEYAEWAGETIPEECLLVTSCDESGGTWTPFHQWFLKFDFDETEKYPFPIVDAGFGGGIKLGEPAGILSKNRKYVTVSFSAIIEPLVRAGLRARR